MIAENSNQAPRRRAQSVASHAVPEPPQSLDVLGALWRYKWAVVLPGIFFAIIGFLVYLTSDETFRCTTRLMVESNRPPMLDAVTGEVVGGVPDIDVLNAQLFSDEVAGTVFNDPRMEPFLEYYDNDLQTFVDEVQTELELEPEVTDIKAAQSLIVLMHFDSNDSEHCEAAIRAYSDALQQFYNERHKGSRQYLAKLIRVAIDDLSPKLTKMEETYRDFRRDSPLSWDTEGNAVNPHREQQNYLTRRRAALYEQLREDATTLAQMEKVAEETEDPRIALNVMAQLLGVKISSGDASRQMDPLAGDTLLAEIDLEKKLLPLIVERNRNEREFGASHPTVRALDQELETTRSELLRLVRDQADRITKLREQWLADIGDPIERAEATMKAVIYSHTAKVKMLGAHIDELDEQIDTEKLKAVELATYESDNEQMLREIEHHRELLGQFQEQMSRAEVGKEEAVTQIVKLRAPRQAYLVWPSLPKLGGIGALIGLLLGSGLALLLEKNADTFRDPSEMSRFLGTAVLAHIPFFRGKRRKLKKGEVDPFKTLSTDLAVVHQPSSVTAEAIRSLRTAIYFDTNELEDGRVIQITSPLPGDGKSTIACNLASSIAQSGKRVLAIDCDLRRPQLTDNFDCADKLGLTNVLNGECDPLEAAHATPLPKLSVMPSGPIPSNPSEALSLPVMNELLDMLREQFDYIILDTPPLLVVTDPSVTASMADGVVMTIRIRRKSKPNAREALNILNGVSANVLGVVINNSEEASSTDGFHVYGQYRYGERYYRRNVQSSGTNVAVTTDGALRRTSSSNGARPSSKIAIGTQPRTRNSGAASSQSDSYGSGSNNQQSTTLMDREEPSDSRSDAKSDQYRNRDSNR